ncbi:MAG: methionyl-tRNA formyltransferase [Oscillospiraceae bacterium]|jgi:methionyl-tRNA formyltransferase|nr:methionyl-tRNA formyltransferase [Oscillospiraceae bacterium]
MNIVFMGTPDFAVPCLQALIDKKYPIAGVFTQPDKPKGRGYKLTPPPVKELALTHDIPVFQPKSLKNVEAFDILKSLQPDLIIVVAYGKILPLPILELPSHGCINVHASLLPKYRGAGPVQWSVLNGETTTGVTTMFMAEGIDTGDMLLKGELAIGENETASELHDRLSVLGANILLKTLVELEKGTLKKQSQDDNCATYAPMLSKEMSLIDFTKPAQQVHNLIRGLSSWPCAHSFLESKQLKVYKSQIIDNYHGKPGEILDNKRFIVGTGDGKAVELLEVQLQGSKRMNSKDFLHGKKIEIGSLLK